MSESMRHEAALEQPVHKEDFEGEEEEWDHVGRIRFSLLTSQGTDTDSDQQVDHGRRYKISTQYREDITPNMRLNFDGRILNIVGQPMDSNLRRQWLDFDCEELIV